VLKQRQLELYHLRRVRSVIAPDLTDDYFPSSAELQVHHDARLRKHGHVFMGVPAMVRQNHLFSLTSPAS
jgi:hypothetical protein